MTCIVGMVDKESGIVWVGGDSASSDGSTKSVRADSKVFRVGDFVIGGSGSWRMIQLLKYSLFPPEVVTKNIFEYMCTSFIDEVIRCFTDGGYIMKDKEDGSILGGTFLVAYKNRLFKVHEDFQVGEVLNGREACGCGSEVALGALHALRDIDLPVQIKIDKALKASEEIAIGIGGPFTIIRTEE